jgi:hypothetical protein
VAAYKNRCCVTFYRRNPIRAYCLAALALAIMLASLVPRQARADDVYSDFQTWLLMTALIPIDADKKFSLYGEIQPRLGDNSRYPERLLIRPAAVGVVRVNP